MKLKYSFLGLLLLVGMASGDEIGDVTRKAVGAFVQLEHGKFRIAWAPNFGEYEVSGLVKAPDCAVRYWVRRCRGRDEWKTGSKDEDWKHIGSTHVIKQERVEKGNQWTVYRVLYWDGKNFVGVHYAECPAIAYRGLTVWKGLSVEWGIVVEAVRQAGYLDVVNDANLLEKARLAIVDTKGK